MTTANVVSVQSASDALLNLFEQINNINPSQTEVHAKAVLGDDLGTQITIDTSYPHRVIKVTWNNHIPQLADSFWIDPEQNRIDFNETGFTSYSEFIAKYPEKDFLAKLQGYIDQHS